MSQDRFSLSELVDREAFVPRHIGPREDQMTDMLQLLNVDSLEALIDRSVPDSIRMERGLDLPPARSEHET